MRKPMPRLVCLSCFGTSVAAVSQVVVPQLCDSGARTTVVRQASGDLFEYAYTVTNGAGSDGPIWRFPVDIARGPGTESLPTTGLDIAFGATTTDFVSGAMNLHLDPEELVPVGCAAPSGWSCGLSRDKQLTWGARQLRAGTERWRHTGRLRAAVARTSRHRRCRARARVRRARRERPARRSRALELCPGSETPRRALPTVAPATTRSTSRGRRRRR